LLSPGINNNKSQNCKQDYFNFYFKSRESLVTPGEEAKEDNDVYEKNEQNNEDKKSLK